MIRTFRWSILVKSLDVHVSFGRLFYLYMAGTFFNTFLPTGIGGDVVKIIDLAPESGGARAFSTVFADRLTGILGTSLIALCRGHHRSGGRAAAVVALVIVRHRRHPGRHAVADAAAVDRSGDASRAGLVEVVEQGQSAANL